MCYKDEVQQKNADKLQRKFEEDSVPFFIQKYLMNKKSMLGALNYWSIIKNLLLWLLENKLINKNSIEGIDPEDMIKIEASDINMYLKQRENNGTSPTTLYTHKNVISGFWKYMSNSPNVPVKSNIINDVAYTGVETNNTFYTRMPSQDDLDEMEKNIRKKPDHFIRERNIVLFTILKETGLRECEVTELEFSSLFLEGSEFDDKPHILIMGKGRYYVQEKRKVLLTGTAKKAFLYWLEIRKTIENIVDDKAIFINKNGKRLSEDNIRAMFKTYSKGKITGHMMRHWYLTLANKKYGAVFAQQQAGHKNANLIASTYADGSYGLKEKLENS